MTKTSKTDEIIKRVEKLEIELAKNTVTSENTLSMVKEIKDCVVGGDCRGGLVKQVNDVESRVKSHEKVGGAMITITGLLLALRQFFHG